jgi:uncharacterized protein (DUF58 family)
MPLIERSAIVPTARGLRFMLLVGLVALACLTTQNNLLYLMLALGLAALALSAATGFLVLAGLKLTPLGPWEFWAGCPAVERLEIANRSSWLDCFGITVVEMDFPGPDSPRARVTWLGRRSRQVLDLKKIYPRRGAHGSAGFRLSTSFPFGLLQMRREARLTRDLLVFPALTRVDVSHVFRGLSGPLPWKRRAGESEELLRVRDYAPGDHLRNVHWKATAKLSRVMIKDFSSEGEQSFCLVLDNSLASWPADPVAHQGFEEMVSLAASIASHLANHRLTFRFVSADRVFPRGAEHLRDVLIYLATVEPTRTPTVATRDEVSRASRAGQAVLFLTSPSGGAEPGFDGAGVFFFRPAVTRFEDRRHAG